MVDQTGVDAAGKPEFVDSSIHPPQLPRFQIELESNSLRDHPETAILADPAVQHPHLLGQRQTAVTDFPQHHVHGGRIQGPTHALPHRGKQESPQQFFFLTPVQVIQVATHIEPRLVDRRHLDAGVVRQRFQQRLLQLPGDLGVPQDGRLHFCAFLDFLFQSPNFLLQLPEQGAVILPEKLILRQNSPVSFIAGRVQHFPDDPQQNLRRLRFDDEPVRPQTQRQRLVLTVGIRGGIENKRDFPQGFIVFPLPAQRESIHFRHQNVGYDQIGREAVRLVPGHATIF